MMYEVIWPQLLLSGRFNIPPGTLRTAQGAMHNALLFAAAMWQANGWVQDPREYFKATTLGPAVDELVKALAVPLDSFQSRLRALPRYPREFRSPFIETPVLQLPDGALLAPDPSVLFPAFERLMTGRILREWVEEGGEDGFQHASTAIGSVFEEYARTLLSTTDVVLGGTFLPEFKYNNGKGVVDSPDIFVLRRAQSLVLELKATRLPFSVEELEADPGTHLKNWLFKILGAGTNRAPLAQGRDFFQQAKGLAPLNGTDLSDAIYLIVVSPDIPPMLNWKSWRDKWLFQVEPSLACDLFHRTAFVSIYDLELAAAASQCGESLADLVTRWWATEYAAAPIALDGIHGRLGDFCRRQVPNLSDHEPAFLQTARDNLFLAADAAGFAKNPLDMSTTLWDDSSTSSWTSAWNLRRARRSDDRTIEGHRRIIRENIKNHGVLTQDNEKHGILEIVRKAQQQVYEIKRRMSGIEGSWEDTWKP